jgi:hypothetical protein
MSDKLQQALLSRSPSLWEGLGGGLAACDTQRNPRGVKARAKANLFSLCRR